jgi:hypothetical protein
MGPEQEKRLIQFNDSLDGTALTLWEIRTGTPMDTPFREFLDWFKQKVPSAKIKNDDALSPKMPGIRMRKNLVWHAVPEGPELSPFLEALSFMVSAPPVMASEVQGELSILDTPAVMDLFIAPGCPFCPNTVRQLVPMTFYSDMVYLNIIDGSFFTDAAQAGDIRSVPTAILDGVYRWTGLPPLLEIAGVMVRRDPEALGQAAFENLIAEGKAGRIAEMMIEKGKIFPAFMEVLTHDQWPVRLGAMVAVEYMVDDAPALAQTLETPLWERFDRAPDTVKGDILHVLGNVGGKESMPRITSIMKTDPSEEVREAAEEALERMKERGLDE